jgi:hypothetical protein
MSTSQTINGLQHYLPATSDAEWGGILSSYLHGLSYAKRSLVVFCGASGLAASTLSYLVPGYAAVSASEAKLVVPFAGVAGRIYVRARTAPVGGLVSLIVNRNGALATMPIDLAVGATTNTDWGTFTFSVSAGDLISVSATPAGGYSSGAADLTVSLSVVPA